MKTVYLFLLLIGSALAGWAQTTIHIDPDYAGNDSDGSIDKPYAGWAEALPEATVVDKTDLDVLQTSSGNTYLQKRGTVDTISLAINMVPETAIGAYGEGDRPVIKLVGTIPDHNGIIRIKNREAADAADTIYRDFTIRDLVIDATDGDVTSCILSEGWVGDTWIENCETIGGGWGIRLLQWDVDQRPATVLHCEIHKSGDDGIWVWATPNLEIGYCYIHDINQNYFTGEQPPTQTTASGDCIQLNGGAKNAWIHHNVLDKSSTEFKFALIIQPGQQDPAHDVLIEYNKMIGQGRDSASVFYLDDYVNATVRGNVFSNAPSGIYNKAIHGSLLAYENIFFDVNFAISNTESTGSQFYNNMMIDCGGVVQSNFVNSLHLANNLVFVPDPDENNFLFKYSRTSAIPSESFSCDYNLYYPDQPGIIDYKFQDYTLTEWQAEGYGQHSLVADPLFTDHLGGDWSLSANSPAIDAGMVIDGITADGDLTPDIGAPIVVLQQMGIGPNAEYRLFGTTESTSYGPYPISDGMVHTDDWMGSLGGAPLAPWLYSWTMEHWLYVPESGLTTDGGWIYIYRQ